jgi:hypothetical protein
VANYTALKLGDLDYLIVKSSRNIARLGLEFISAKELEAHCRKIKQFLPGSTTNAKGESIPTSVPFDAMQVDLVRRYG